MESGRRSANLQSDCQLVLGPNGSLYPWVAPVVLAIVGAALLVTGSYVGGVVLVVAAIVVRWLHQIAIDRGAYP